MPRIYYSTIPSSAGQRQEPCGRVLVVPLIVLTCVCLSLRYGYYGDRRLVLGPNSSRMLEVRSLFVKRIELRDETRSGGVVLYGFDKKPELSVETNWTLLHRLYLDSYGRRGFSLWLNKGSRIRMRWGLVNGRGSLENLLVVLIKGEEKLESLRKSSNEYNFDLRGGSRPCKEAEYSIEEDDSYYIGAVNLEALSFDMSMEVNVSSKLYDARRAASICSPINEGLCKIRLFFPSSRYVLLTTPSSSSNATIHVWNVGLSFVARFLTYFVIVGFVALVICLVLKYLGACDQEGVSSVERETMPVTQSTETDPMVPRKEMACTYGTTEEDPEMSLCCSSEDLYDGKICVICYDSSRNCFFTPCGHNATCFSCAQRIMEEDSKVCPICRRLIHKVKKLMGA